MKTLILSCNTGEGHNSCSEAIKEYFNDMGEECFVADGLTFISPSVSETISKGHSYIYRHLPWIFKHSYSYAEKHPEIFYENSVINRFLTSGKDKLYNFLCENNFDTVICPHVITALEMTAVKKKYGCRINTAFVATDYTCSPITSESDMDFYFIPSHDLISEYSEQKIPSEKIIASGIPVKRIYHSYRTNECSKRKIGLTTCNRHILLMCGSMGCGPIRNILKSLADRIDSNTDITVVCGNNRKLKNKLRKSYSDYPNIKILGYRYDMPLLINSSDIILTKPGGITITEAAAKKVPMILIDAVSGCETHNMNYFVSHKMAFCGKCPKDTAKLCLNILENTEIAEKQVRCMEKINLSNASKIIYDKMRSLKICNDISKTVKER